MGLGTRSGTRNSNYVAEKGNHAFGFQSRPWVVTDRSLIGAIGCGRDITPIRQGCEILALWSKRRLWFLTSSFHDLSPKMTYFNEISLMQVNTWESITKL